MLRLALAALHLIALGIGLGAVLMRGAALREHASTPSLRRAFNADRDWGLAAILWIGTGLWRYLGETEKTSEYYNGNHIFLTKMGLLLLVLALEVWPAMTLVRWRRALGKGGTPEVVAVSGTARQIAFISHVQALLVVLMVAAAVAMARGYGAGG
jgi:putative membrane protein